MTHRVDPEADAEVGVSPSKAEGCPFHGDALPTSLLAKEILQDPYPTYARIRHEAPVTHISDQDIWLVTKYDDCEFILEHPDLFSSREAVSSTNAYRKHPEALKILKQSRAQPRARTLINADPPEHAQFRAILQRSLAPAKTLRELTPRIREIVDDLIDGFSDRGRCHFIREFAYPLPMRIVAAIFNVPDTMIERLKSWSDDFISVQAGNISPERVVDAARHTIEFEEFILDQVERRKREPQDDFLGRLVDQPPEEHKLTEPELLNICLQVLVGGNETTTNFLGNAIHRLLATPGLKDMLMTNPERVPDVVEEALRFESPLQGLFRIAKEAHRFGDVVVPKGAKLMVCFGSANRDEQYYDDGSFDPDRDNRSTIHLAFGRGVHSCAGQAFARREGVIAITRLLERLENLRISSEIPPERHQLFSIFGFKELVLEFDADKAASPRHEGTSR